MEVISSDARSGRSRDRPGHEHPQFIGVTQRRCDVEGGHVIAAQEPESAAQSALWEPAWQKNHRSHLVMGRYFRSNYSEVLWFLTRHSEADLGRCARRPHDFRILTFRKSSLRRNHRSTRCYICLPPRHDFQVMSWQLPPDLLLHSYAESLILATMLRAMPMFFLYRTTVSKGLCHRRPGRYRGWPDHACSTGQPGRPRKYGSRL
jgi:hypothetical protein